MTSFDTNTNNLFQYSTLSAIMEGICEGGTTVADVLAKGDHGIGTLPGLSGEVVMIDGEAYYYSADLPRKLEESDLLPFAMITRFRPTWTHQIPNLSFSSLPDSLTEFLPSRQNCFLSVRLDGLFEDITYRVIQGQTKPRERPLEVMKRQALKSRSMVQGIIFGFMSPGFACAFSAAGFHLHFVSNDHSLGGHIMDFKASSLTLSASAISDYHVQLPQSPQHNEFPIQGPSKADLNALLKGQLKLA